MNSWDALLAKPGVILADGAMGTMLFEAGLEFGDPPEAWNVEYPERVRVVHRAYLEAGSHILLTNTFGGSRFRLGLHNLSARAGELNRAAAENLRAVVDEFDGLAVVGGDIGPSGEIMAPLGTLDYADAVDGFAEQAAGLVEGGVDVIWIETMSDLAEMQAAIEGTRRVSPTIPIVATMTFDTHGHTMMGVSPEKAANALASWGVAFFEYQFQVPANRIGYAALSLPQLKILQEAISLLVFVPFSIVYMRAPVGADYFWACACILGAVFFLFRAAA